MRCLFVSPKLVIMFLVRACSSFASSGVCATANLIVITPNEQTGAESIVYLPGTVTRSSSFTKPGFKNQTAPEQTITKWKREKMILAGLTRRHPEAAKIPAKPRILTKGRVYSHHPHTLVA